MKVTFTRDTVRNDVLVTVAGRVITDANGDARLIAANTPLSAMPGATQAVFIDELRDMLEVAGVVVEMEEDDYPDIDPPAEVPEEGETVEGEEAPTEGEGEETPEEEAPAAENPVDFGSMNKDQLIAECEALSLDYTASMKKDELRTLLEETTKV